MTPLEYAEFLSQEKMAKIIESKQNGPSLEERWLKTVETLDINHIEEFRTKFNNAPNKTHLLNLGLIKAAEIGSNRLIDFFLTNKEVNINTLCRLDKILVTPLLRSIQCKRNETTKYLIFRKADINLAGEFGDGLVTAVHFENSNDMITLLLEKGASLASRHKLWPNLNLREYCIQTNKIQAKLAIDNFVFKLIANGEYDKLKCLTDKGYININVTNQFKKTGRDLAMERSHVNIVQLIDKIEEKQRRLRTKMNY
ncbi:hypothetical protein BpHYR1_021758 [Brachionus plicatilis]|uniref:Uncharacterized protein n=1 Tax=Brachionus plicatilis TaxID=10195 RepID=A0A3M7QWI4_BRAPC|nr:hypothetical protein BpHYR1_021758 [Brachionus plicatilis]